MGWLLQVMSRLARLAGGSNTTGHDRLALAQRF
ncbi:DNA-binding protein, partial [Salmonella enterica subsp. enterica serovar Weltevreden]|nr:DNA-binding protein [Salmonella enterica subsp. enterica serovar Weltevreden]